MPPNTVLVSGPAVEVAQILIWSYSCVFLPPMYTAIRTSAFLCVCGSSHCPFIYSVDRVCLVNRVDLVFSLYSWWEGFGSALVSIVVLFPPVHVGRPLGFAPEACS